MKNIHILPTDQPSRLVKIKDNFFITSSVDIPGGTFYNIYITNDEEIKEGDWLYHRASNKLFKYDGQGLCVEVEKIILTTDQDLINDGVQAIDDDFLEWFVKNPSCEEVEVKDVFKSSPIGFGNAFDYYKITIPKEKPKPEYSKIKEGLKKSIKGKEHFIHHFKNGGTVEDFKPLEELNQETLEEAAKRLAKDAYKKHSVKDDKLSLDEQIQRSGGFIVGFKEGMIDGAKWQQERMYSDEEVIELLLKALTHKDNGETGNLITAQGEIRTANFYSWFEQNKKK